LKRVWVGTICVSLVVFVLSGCFVIEFFFPPEKKLYKANFYAYFYNVHPKNHSLQGVDIPIQSLNFGGQEIAEQRIIELSLTPSGEVDEFADLFAFLVVPLYGSLDFAEEQIPIRQPAITITLGSTLTAHYINPETQEPFAVDLPIQQSSRTLVLNLKDLTTSGFSTKDRLFLNPVETQIFMVFNLVNLPQWDNYDETVPVSLGQSIYMITDDLVLLYGRILSQDEDLLLPGQRWSLSFQDDPLLYLGGFPFRALSYPVAPLDQHHYFLLIPKMKQMPSYIGRLELFGPENPSDQPAKTINITVSTAVTRILQHIQAGEEEE